MQNSRYSLNNKTILILSPQEWGAMLLSKHHYAIELAKKENSVYFLNPPREKLGNKIVIDTVEGIPGLKLINHSLPFFYNIKFHSLPLFHFLMKGHIKRILKKIGADVDIVWSFDLGYIYPFKHFSDKSIKVFHPVDEPLNQTALDSATGADIVFSVTNEILEKYHHLGKPSHFINHGVSNKFFNLSNKVFAKDGSSIRVGFSGNLLRNDIDRNTFIKIIRENPEVRFECWGSYRKKDANLSGSSDKQTMDFIEELMGFHNVKLHGVVSTEELVLSYKNVDCFLICYDINKDQSKGTNYHKIMEFLSSGNVVVANNVSTYANRPDLLQMCKSRLSNDELPGLFKAVIENISWHNATENQQNRVEYAFQNRYSKQLEAIEQILIRELKNKYTSQ